MNDLDLPEGGCWDAEFRKAQGDVKTVIVVAAVLVDIDGRVLVAQRPEGKAMAGLWEFPGGKLEPGETPEMKRIRFRTLGCYPLTGAVESDAVTLPEIIREMLLARSSERQGRAIDKDASASMEQKKQQGYF